MEKRQKDAFCEQFAFELDWNGLKETTHVNIHIAPKKLI